MAERRCRARSSRWPHARSPKRHCQAVVDPYARADFFISFAEEGVEVEEGFITFPTLPGAACY
mgnify:CR=1 FL=1